MQGDKKPLGGKDSQQSRGKKKEAADESGQKESRAKALTYVIQSGKGITMDFYVRGEKVGEEALKKKKGIGGSHESRIRN